MIYLLIVTLIWGFSFGLIKGQLTSLNPILVAFIRIFISLLIFLPFLKFGNLNPKMRVKLMAIGAIQFGIMYLSYIYSYQYLQAYEVALLTIFTPIYISLINDITEKSFSAQNLLIAFIAIVGTGIIVYNKDNSLNISIGIILIQISNLCFAAGQIFYKKIKNDIDEEGQTLFGWLYIGAIMTLILPMFFTSSFSQIFEISFNQWITLIYLGAVASGISFFLWNKGATMVSTPILAVSNNLKVPAAIIISLLVFGENTDLFKLFIGGSVILLSFYLSYRTTRN